MKKIIKYIKLWWIMTTHVSEIALSSRFGAAIFILGKLLRFAFFGIFLLLLIVKTKNIAGYNIWEIILFFMTFNLIDTGAQFLWREVYRFRDYILSGNFDYFLTKPMSPLFRSLFGGSDILDVVLLFLSVAFIGIAMQHISGITFFAVFLYILFVLNAFVIALSFHILILSMGILTTEIDSALWIYRDLTQMGRIPVDVYKQPFQTVLTFVIPIAIMMTFPGKVVIGALSISVIFISFLFGAGLFYSAIKFWEYALRFYVSASS
ncbi:MAG: ABC-2 family transporter protein [Candidatus Levyibacteriota bacterium]